MTRKSNIETFSWNPPTFPILTGPFDSISKGTKPTDLSPPTVAIELLPTEEIRLRWSWPAEYADRLAFGVRWSTNLRPPYTDTAVVPTYLGNDHFEAVISPPGVNHLFYEVYMSLK